MFLQVLYNVYMKNKTMKPKKLTKKQIVEKELKLKFCDKFWEFVDKFEDKNKCNISINIEELKIK